MPAPTTVDELLAPTLDYLDVQFLEEAPHGDGDKPVAAKFVALVDPAVPPYGPEIKALLSRLLAEPINAPAPP